MKQGSRTWSKNIFDEPDTPRGKGMRFILVGVLVLFAGLVAVVMVASPFVEELGIDVISGIQSNKDIANFLSAFSVEGSTLFLLCVIGVITFGVDFGFGLVLLLVYSLLHVVDSVLKDLLHRPRPGWISSDIATTCTVQYGFPSAHAAAVVLTMGGAIVVIAPHVPKHLSTLLSILVGLSVLLTGVSRIALGAHAPDQILAGWLEGTAFLCVLVSSEKAVQIWMRTELLDSSWTVTLLGSLGWGVMLVSASLGPYWINKTYWEVPASWRAERVAQCDSDLEVVAFDMEFASMLSSWFFLGMAATIPLVAKIQVEFIPMVYDGSVFKAFVRIMLVAGVGTALHYAFNQIPSTDTFLVVLICRNFLRGMAFVSVGVLGSSWVAKVLGLVESDLMVL